jgi:virginiamycin B lyase
MTVDSPRSAGHWFWLASLILLLALLAACTTPSEDAAPGDARATPAQLPETGPSPPAVSTAMAPDATDSPGVPSPTAPDAGETPGRSATPESTATAAGDDVPTVCPPTQPDQLGPFYEPGAPQRDTVGQGHVLAGTVRSSADCSPLAGAQIEFWLAGPEGYYDDAHRATVFSDEAGSYRFESNFPPAYSGRPPHIHIRVSGQGYETLVTQYYPPAGQAQGSFDLVLVPQAPAATATATAFTQASAEPTLEEFPVPPGSRPHDVAPAPDGAVWYTAQGSGQLGRLDPSTGETRHVDLGAGSAPHGVIVGPDGAPWITDGGLNAIVRVDPGTEEVQVYPLPEGSPSANLNTATFDHNGVLWFTGQNGVYGRLDPAAGQVETFDAPRGRGPYGIATAPDGTVYYASLAGGHIARVDVETGDATLLQPPTPGQGARRVWPDSQGRIWVSEWNARQVAVYDPGNDTWQEWQLPGDSPQPYAVYVDDRDVVWLSDFDANAIVRFDPETETFDVLALPSSPANVRQLLGRPGEVWGAESGVDKLVVVRTQ